MNNFTFTYDLEEHMPHRQDASRYQSITLRLLDFLEEKKVKGTFFVVGELAKNNPKLIKTIDEKGHEIGFHSMRHKQLSSETPESFALGNSEGIAILEDMIGKPIKGYRAPVFSLTPETKWAVDILKEQGFEYSSSILPAKNPLHGFQGAPNKPFQWHNGLIEIPVPIAKLGPLSVPFLGGFYLRYMPMPLVRYFCKIEQGQALWSYVHPYDFDPEESFGRIAGASWLVSFLLWMNRTNTFKKLDGVFQQFDNESVNSSFAMQLEAGKFNDLPVFEILS
jgi:polysaccharide deacetylase family protein (PEP-CTERM system associated)